LVDAVALERFRGAPTRKTGGGYGDEPWSEFASASNDVRASSFDFRSAVTPSRGCDSASNAEYRANVSHFSWQHRDTACIALIHLGAVIAG
jgi:hypothetical protein